MKKLLSFLALISLTFSGLVATALPASASTAADDATLANVTIGNDAWINTSFTPSRTYYDVYASRAAVNWEFQSANPLATIKVTEPTGTVTTTTGTNTLVINYAPATNQVTTVLVTSPDSSNTITYTFNVSSKVIVQPELKYLSESKVSNVGSSYITVTLQHVFMGDPNERCDTTAYYQYTNWNGDLTEQYMGRSSFTQGNDGTTTAVFEVYYPYAKFDLTGKTSMSFVNWCYSHAEDDSWTRSDSSSIYKDALEFYEPSVTSNTIPDTVSFDEVFDIKGPGLTGSGIVNLYMLDPATGQTVWNDRWRMGEDWSRWRLGGAWYNTQDWSKKKPVDIILEHYDYNYGHASIVLLKKRVTFVPYAPKNVSVTRAKGPIAGGNLVRIQGQNLCNRFMGEGGMATLYIGGQWAPTSWGTSTCHWGNYSSDGYRIDGVDTVEFTVPAGSQAGQVPMTIDIGYGPITLSAKYTYGAKPTLTSVSPATVANTGGSIVTLTGTGFGTSGNPTVTMDGIKSPWVQRVSGTKILAMVPANAAKTGAVDLNIISSSGGGALDLPGTITLANATTNPVITSVSPESAGIAGGDTITIKGTGFTAGTTGVYIGDLVAPIISSSATQIQVELPSSDVAGIVDIKVGTPTGLATKTGSFTYLPTPGVTSITPSAISTTTVTANSKVTIVGVGFGNTGTIKVGTKAAVAYTATSGGTTIANVAIPNAEAGLVPVVVTPTGSKRSFNGTVVVTGPTLTNFGLDSDWRAAGIISSSTYSRAVSSPAGGGKFRLDGSGFGTSGKIKVGTTLVTPTSYTDTAITFVMPAKVAGIYDITVVPNQGSATAVAKRALGVQAAEVGITISKIESSVANTRGAERFTFDKLLDASDVFVITGTKLNGTNGSKTRVYVGGEQSEAITPISVSATSVTFRAPRTLGLGSWYSVTVVTNVDKTSQNMGIQYVGNIPSTPVVEPTMSPNRGFCLKTPTAGRNPGQFTASGAGLFGTSGTVNFGGVDLPAGAVTWSADSVTVNLANQTSDLANPWGSKSVVFTPTDSSLIPVTFSYNCSVSATVSTTLAGSTNTLTISAGTSYTAGASFVDPLPNDTFAPSADGYYWQSAADHAQAPWAQNIHSGLPIAAGDYYVRANIGAGTYDREKYTTVTNSNDVHLVINGTPISFTPKLRANAGNSITYKGQLGDGTNGTSNDIMFTNTTAANAVTGVTWQFRNHACALANANYGWSSGLPRDVAVDEVSCGGNGTTVTSWEIRVASFEMLSGGVDRSVYYIPTFNTFLLTINKKSVTATTVKVEKVYDGTTAATLGEVTLTGAIDGDAVTLNSSSSQGATFADASAGSGKAITLASPLALADNWARNYTLTNANLSITGKILKADAKVKLTSSLSSVVISTPQPINITVATTDTRNGATPDVLALLADAVVTSKTPGKCTYSGGVVTAVAPGDCIIEARQAASTNYNASIAWHDDSTTVESITIKIYPAPKTLSVVADDITVAVGEGFGGSAIVTGLLDGDNLDGFGFDFYQGNTLLSGPPTAVGTYRIVPTGGNLSAADSALYSNVYKYVAGKLVITPAPPTLTLISPNHGPEAGGNTVVLTGTGFENVTSVVIGGVTLRKPKFTVNGTGTEITFKAPAGVGIVDLTLRAGTASVTGQYIYDEPPVVTSEFGINIETLPEVGKRLSGQKVQITGGGLKPNSEYNLTIGSNKVSLLKGVTDANGSFSRTVTIPRKACLAAGKQTLTLVGKKSDDTQASDTAQIVLDSNCSVLAVAEKTESKQWTLSGFLFNYLKFDLTDGGVKSLAALAPLVKGAKTITVYGYTQTDAVSEATKKANLILATNRCKTVVDFFKSKGIKADYKIFGMGGVDPVSTTDQSKNRRVVIQADY